MQTSTKQTPTKLSNVQLELLKVFSRNVPEDELKEIKNLLADYFSKKATEKASKFWDEKGLTNDDMDKWINEPS